MKRKSLVRVDRGPQIANLAERCRESIREWSVDGGDPDDAEVIIGGKFAYAVDVLMALSYVAPDLAGERGELH